MSEYALEILDGERAGDVVSLTESRFSIGRRPSNDIVLVDEKASGQHAEVVREGDAWVLRDLGSTNGTLLDGKKVTEIGLSPGDVFQIGRIRVRFGVPGEAGDGVATAPSAAGDFALHRIDQSRLSRVKRSGGMLGLTVALLLAIGGGVWAWMTFGRTEVRRAGRDNREPLRVAGNLLPGTVGSCEADDGWQTAAAGGDGFRASGTPHTGTSSMEVLAGEEAGHAVLRSAEGVRVLGGDALQLRAFAQTAGGARVAMRARFSSSREDDTSIAITGTALQEVDGWTELTLDVAVPPDRDRLQIEFLAVLPASDGQVAVDDAAITKGGDAHAVDLSARNGTRLTGSGCALRMGTLEEPMLLGVHPTQVEAPLQPVAAAGLLVATDVGQELTATVADDTFTLRGSQRGLWLELPDASPPIVRSGEAPSFAALPVATDATMREALVGSGATRMLIRSEAAVAVRFEPLAGGGGRLLLPDSDGIELVVSFEEPRRLARERIRAAEADVAAGRSGAALVELQRVADETPHDDQVLREAQSLRRQITSDIEDKTRQLVADAGEAEFFGSRSGLRGVVSRADALLQRIGEVTVEVPGLEQVQELRASCAQRLATADGEAFAERAEGLQRLAAAFQRAGQTELAGLIQNYVKTQGEGR